MERFGFIKDKNFNELPKTSGVYSFYEKTKVIYIGKAINLQSRVKNHFNGKYWWEKALRRDGSSGRIGFIKTNSEIEALILEASLIKKYQPKFNIVWRDDKNYFYVAIAKNSNGIPYVYITHQPKKFEIRNSKFEILYIGPFVEGIALKKTLRFLRHAFPYYTTKKHPKNKCTWCHLGLCPGPELFGNPTSPEASRGLREYKKNIKKLILILKGKRNAVLNSLKKEMSALSKEKRFEEAGKIRDRISNLQQVMAHTNVINSPIITEQTGEEMAGFFARAKNAAILHRIECYDVSNIQGKFATGSMVVFIDGKPARNYYRKFKIKLKNEPNDIAMLKEILQRRFTHSDWKYPEVILIDGGKAQLNIAIEVKNKLQTTNYKLPTIKIISIAKGRQELFIEGRENPIPLKNLPQEVYNLIKLLDDEAHRFAITYHKKLRRKDLLE